MLRDWIFIRRAVPALLMSPPGATTTMAPTYPNTFVVGGKPRSVVRLVVFSVRCGVGLHGVYSQSRTSTLSSGQIQLVLTSENPVVEVPECIMRNRFVTL